MIFSGENIVETIFINKNFSIGPIKTFVKLGNVTLINFFPENSFMVLAVSRKIIFLFKVETKNKIKINHFFSCITPDSSFSALSSVIVTRQLYPSHLQLCFFDEKNFKIDRTMRFICLNINISTKKINHKFTYNLEKNLEFICGCLVDNTFYLATHNGIVFELNVVFNKKYLLIFTGKRLRNLTNTRIYHIQKSNDNTKLFIIDENSLSLIICITDLKIIYYEKNESYNFSNFVLGMIKKEGDNDGTIL